MLNLEQSSGNVLEFVLAQGCRGKIANAQHIADFIITRIASTVAFCAPVGILAGSSPSS